MSCNMPFGVNRCCGRIPCIYPGRSLHTQLPKAEATLAWERYVQEQWGGWTLFASMHTQTTSAMIRSAFFAGWESRK